MSRLHVIHTHPRFNSDTIRKYGKSRSRDGERDIEVYDIPRTAGDILVNGFSSAN
ncbi:hypothetical protein ECZU41_51190 [Escherichia coli]|jgi:hypothetical protein|nr:hypothetical protein ECZU41_51190 [Escherichia coli]GHO33553.1 hypothetical protein MY014_41970 [Escherichia coli]